MLPKLGISLFERQREREKEAGPETRCSDSLPSCLPIQGSWTKTRAKTGTSASDFPRLHCFFQIDFLITVCQTKILSRWSQILTLLHTGKDNDSEKVQSQS